MKSRNVELKVGVFVVLSIIVLTVSYLWMKQAKLKGKGYTITINFNDATGLKRGDPVWVLGVEKGKVLSIRLDQDKVSTLCYIDADVKLKKDAKAAIKDIALISGTKFVELKTGEDEKLFDISKPLEGKGAPTFSLSELGEILGPIRNIAEKISEKNIDKILENIDIASEELVAVIRENRKGIKRTIKSAESDLKKFSAVADKLFESLESLSQLLDDINKEKGTIGMLMKDKKLYNELEATLQETKELIKDIKENPKRYINIKIF